MPINHYVTLGRSGLRVSPLCLGTMTFGPDWGWGTSPDDAARILDRYIEHGGNFVDTANVYTKGHAEKIVGDYFSQSPSRRQRMVLATKFFGSMLSGDPNSGGTGRKAVMSACDESLRRLRTDYIDLYWMHCWDLHTPIEETLHALEHLVSAGKIRYIGFSDTPAWKTMEALMLTRIHGWSRIIALQMEYSLLERTIEGEVVPMALEQQLGIVPWSPLKGGLLSGKYTRENAGKQKAARGDEMLDALNDCGYAIIDALRAVAIEVHSTPARVALAWLRGRPGIASIIVGARSVAQLDDNLSAIDLNLSEAQRARLDHLSAPALNFPAEFVKGAPAFSSSGTTINGIVAPNNPMLPATEDDRY
jgi:aryl-alcohol dehydrogenase-like predicted oxidoreductase